MKPLIGFILVIVFGVVVVCQVEGRRAVPPTPHYITVEVQGHDEPPWEDWKAVIHATNMRVAAQREALK